jgi:hypothetical protein
VKRLAVILLLIIPNVIYAKSTCTAHITPSGYIYDLHSRIHVLLHINTSEHDRTGTVEFQSEDYYSRSDFQIEGGSSRTVWDFTYGLGGVGDYDATLTVRELVGAKWLESSCQSEKLVVLE